MAGRGGYIALMGYQDRDWYRDHHKGQFRAARPPASPRAPSAESARRFERVGVRPGRPVVVRAKPLGGWSRIFAAPAWVIVIFWVVVVSGLTFFFQPVASERAARRAFQPVVELVCSASAKCT